jgi:hypothetical protein
LIWALVGLFMNFSRLTDKALREYDAARAELLIYFTPVDGGLLRTTPYLRAIDHMENCVSATNRAVLNARALRVNKVCEERAAPDSSARRAAVLPPQHHRALRREATGQAVPQEPGVRPD